MAKEVREGALRSRERCAYKDSTVAFIVVFCKPHFVTLISKRNEPQQVFIPEIYRGPSRIDQVQSVEEAKPRLSFATPGLLHYLCRRVRQRGHRRLATVTTLWENVLRAITEVFLE